MMGTCRFFMVCVGSPLDHITIPSLVINPVVECMTVARCFRVKKSVDSTCIVFCSRVHIVTILVLFRLDLILNFRRKVLGLV